MLALIAFDPTPHPGGDNGAYISLARALLEHQRYVDLWDPALPPHNQYPPAFPAILALAMLARIEGWVGLKLVVVAFSSAAVAFSYLYARRATTPGIALGVGLLLAVSPGVVNQSHWILSDVPFWALTAAALWAWSHLGTEEASERGRGETGWIATGIFLVILAYFTRSAGIALALALLVWLLLHRRYFPMLLFVAALGSLAVLWWLRAQAAGAPGYLSAFRWVDPYQPALGTIGSLGLLERVAANLERYAGTHTPLLLFGSARAGIIAGAVLTLLALAGWLRRVRRPGVGEIWFPLYGGLLLLWPVTWSGERLLLPLLPLLLLYAAESVRDAGIRLKRPWLVRSLAVAVLAAIALPGLLQELNRGIACRAEQRAGNPFGCLDPVWGDYFRLAAALQGELPQGSVVLARKPTLLFVLSGYQSRTYPLSAEPDAFFRAAEEAGAGFVVVDQIPDLAPLYLHPVLLSRRDDFCVVPELVFAEAALGRIDRGGPPRDPDAPPNAFRSCPLTDGKR